MDAINLGVRAIIKTDQGLVMVEQMHRQDGQILIFPGGGLQPGESIFRAVKREVEEETNLIVQPDKIVYLRETLNQGNSGIEFYVLCSLLGGALSLGNDPELAEGKQILQAVRVVSWVELENNQWYPEELHGRLKRDLDSDLSDIIYLGIKDFK